MDRKAEAGDRVRLLYNGYRQVPYRLSGKEGTVVRIEDYAYGPRYTVELDDQTRWIVRPDQISVIEKGQPK
jgi:hypothetical protein